MYLKPAVKRAEAMERERKGLPQLAPENAPAMTAPPHRETVVRTAMAMLGRSRKDAEADYDSQLAEWNKQQEG